MTTSYGKISAAVLASLAGLACSGGLAAAATISLVNGTTNNATLNQTVATPMGSNASVVGSSGYGSTGYIMFGTDVPSNVTYGFTEQGIAPTAEDVNYSYNTGNIATVESLPSWLTTTTTSGTTTTTAANITMDPSLTPASYFMAAAYGYPVMSVDGQPAAGSYPTNHGVAAGSPLQTGEGGQNGTTVGTLYKLFDITLGADTPSNFKLGVIAPQGYDALSQIQVSDGSASSSVNVDPAQNLAFYFFNISGASAGDTVVVSAAASPTVAGGYFTHNPYGTSTDLVGMTFDAPTVSTPEPAALGVFALGGLGMLLIGRKRVIRRTA